MVKSVVKKDDGEDGCENPMFVAISNIEKQMGNKDYKKNPVIKSASLRANCTVEVISFGVKAVDNASNCGGVPKGKMIEVFGPESGGKSYLTLRLIASVQRTGRRALLIDAENSFDPVWATSHGVNLDLLDIIDDPMSAEVALEWVKNSCDSSIYGLIVVDSTAALVPGDELEGKISDQSVGLLARIMSRACRTIMQSCSKTETTVVFINQIRDKIAMGGKPMFGDTTSTPGGRALKFYCHQRINVVPLQKISVEENGKKVVVGRTSIVKFVKNKVARPFGECVMEIIFDADSMNPTVRLCKIARKSSVKTVSVYKDEFRISKDLSSDGKVICTGTNTIVNLADYLVKNKMVDLVLQGSIKALEYLKDNGDLDEEGESDLDYLESLSAEPLSLISPLANAVSEVSKIQSDVDETTEEDDKEFLEGKDGKDGKDGLE